MSVDWDGKWIQTWSHNIFAELRHPRQSVASGRRDIWKWQKCLFLSFLYVKLSLRGINGKLENSSCMFGFSIVIKAPLALLQQPTTTGIHCYQRRDSEIWIGMKMNIPRKSFECLEHQYNTTSSQSFVVLLSGRVHNSCFHSAGKHWQAK